MLNGLVHNIRLNNCCFSASVVKCRIVADVQASPYFALLLDETTDVAVMKQLIIYIKYSLTSAEKIGTSFLAIEDVSIREIDFLGDVQFCCKRLFLVSDGMLKAAYVCDDFIDKMHNCILK